jgi:hypothetical protein
MSFARNSLQYASNFGVHTFRLKCDIERIRQRRPYCWDDSPTGKSSCFNIYVRTGNAQLHEDLAIYGMQIYFRKEGIITHASLKKERDIQL